MYMYKQGLFWEPWVSFAAAARTQVVTYGMRECSLLQMVCDISSSPRLMVNKGGSDLINDASYSSQSADVV